MRGVLLRSRLYRRPEVLAALAAALKVGPQPEQGGLKETKLANRNRPTLNDSEEDLDFTTPGKPAAIPRTVPAHQLGFQVDEDRLVSI